MTGAIINSHHVGNGPGCGKEGMVGSLSVYVHLISSNKRVTYDLLCKSIIVCVCVHCVGLHSSEGSAVLGAHTQH